MSVIDNKPVQPQPQSQLPEGLVAGEPVGQEANPVTAAPPTHANPSALPEGLVAGDPIDAQEGASHEQVMPLSVKGAEAIGQGGAEGIYGLAKGLVELPAKEIAYGVDQFQHIGERKEYEAELEKAGEEHKTKVYDDFKKDFHAGQYGKAFTGLLGLFDPNVGMDKNDPAVQFAAEQWNLSALAKDRAKQALKDGKYGEALQHAAGIVPVANAVDAAVEEYLKDPSYDNLKNIVANAVPAFVPSMVKGVKKLGGVRGAAIDAVRPTTENVGGEPVQVRAKGAFPEAVAKAVDHSVIEKGAEKTAADVQQGVGEVTRKAVGSNADTAITDQDRFGVRAHANDLLETQSRPAMQKLDELSDNAYSEAQKMAKDASRDFTAKGREDYDTALKLQDSIIEDHRAELERQGLDVDEMRANYRKGIALNKIASSLDTATDAKEGGGYKVNGKKLASAIDRIRRVPGDKNLFQRAGMTPEHISALGDLADTLRDQQVVPKVGSLSKLMAKGMAIALSGGHGITGLAEALAGESLAEKLGTKAMTAMFGQAMQDEGSARKLNEAIKSGDPNVLGNWDKFKAFAAELWKSERGEAGLPGTVTDRDVASSADAYNEKNGRGPVEIVAPENNPRAKDVADAYQKMEHNPNDPAVKASYDAFKGEVNDQWDHAVEDGFKFEPWKEEGQPYKNSQEMRNDVQKNKHLYFYQGGEWPEGHPLAEVDPKTGLTINDKFRAVHDLYGHAAGGYEFGPKGEEAAYRTHAQMFSKDAIPALTSETRGQNSWVNFGEHLRDAEGNIPKRGEPGYVAQTDRPYAEQKAGLLPDEFYHGNENIDPQILELKKKYGTTSDVQKAGFITPDGDMIPLKGEHDRMLGGKPTDNLREGFIKDTGTIRTRYRMSRAGEEQVFSLPEEITEDQARRIRQAAGQLRHGRVVLETVDGKNSKTLDFPTGRDTTDALNDLVKIKDDAPANITPNGSGNTSASQEAINREASNKAQGVRTYRVDTRTGNAVPVIGVDTVDASAKPYEKIVQVKGDQITEVDSGRGARPIDEQALLAKLTPKTNSRILSDIGGDAKLVGSHSTGAAGANSDVDVLVSGKFDPATLESQGYKQTSGSSVVSPKEAAEYDKPVNSGWSRIYHFETPEGKALDVWTSESAPKEFPKDFAATQAAKDTELFGQARKNLGADASLSDLALEAQRLKDESNGITPESKEITTRRPWSSDADPANKAGQHSNWEAIEEASRNSPPRTTQSGSSVMGYKEKLARTVANYTGVPYSESDLMNPDKVLSKFVNHAASNIEWLYNQVPPEIREQTRKWYSSANKVLADIAKKNGVTHEQAAGVTAALSPQNPWDNNVGLAKRMIDIYKNRQNIKFSPEMEEAAARLKQVPTQSKAFKGLLKDIAGKKLKDVKNPDPDVQAMQRALWVRLYDEAHGSPINDQYSPNGEVTGQSPDSRSWIGLDHMGKAVKILEDGSVDAINNVMGRGHKIRNFYNNLINPDSPNGHVTIDTHATAAAQLQPFGAKDTETAHTFGTTTPGTPGPPKNAAAGVAGTYPLYAEAYQRVARKLGILPRELQSVIWEGIKSLMGDDKKNPEMKSRVKEIWQDVQDGKLTANKAREMIKEEANGFSKPSWMSDEEWEKHNPEGDTSFDVSDDTKSATPTKTGWITPEGKMLDIGDEAHEDAAVRMGLSTDRSAKRASEHFDSAMKNGYIRSKVGIGGHEASFNAETDNRRVLEQAIKNLPPNIDTVRVEIMNPYQYAAGTPEDVLQKLDSKHASGFDPKFLGGK